MPTKFRDVVEARIAATQTSDPVLLLELSNYPFVYVKLAVAHNPAATASVLASLISEEYTEDGFRVAEAVLQHPTSTERHCAVALLRLGNPPLQIEARNFSGRSLVRVLFAHPHLPKQAAAAILPMLADHLRSLIATSSDNDMVLRCLVQDRSSTIARKASKRLEKLQGSVANSQ